MIRILKCGLSSPEEILSRSFPVSEVGETVAEIIRNVRERGDTALKEYTERFDGVVIGDFSVSEEEMEEALGAVSDGFKAVLEKAAANIRRFHSCQIREGYRIENPDGTVAVTGRAVMLVTETGKRTQLALKHGKRPPLISNRTRLVRNSIRADSSLRPAGLSLAGYEERR